jgi:hypothetical protein
MDECRDLYNNNGAHRPVKSANFGQGHLLVVVAGLSEWIKDEGDVDISACAE